MHPSPSPIPSSLPWPPGPFPLPLLVAILCFAVLSNPLHSCADPTLVITAPPSAPAEARAAQSRLKTAPGLQVQLWASEPLVRNITSLSFDDHGRAYVVETGRRRTSVFDIRGLQPWLDDEYSFQTVEDRADFLRKHLTPSHPAYPAFLAAVNKKGGLEDFNRDGIVDFRDLEIESERIQLVTDRDNNGFADTSATFADHFQSPVSGVAAGVLVQRDQVWFTCIPDLWRFKAAPMDPTPFTPAQGERLHTGFGVHIAFGGHDMHGLILGPDGRLYFSIADRGANVPLPNRQRAINPHSGAVFRCNPDGSELELYATGLRNPQELAFDAHGNLWTGDNNGDGGDKARWTYVVEGANYGWTMGWQWLPKMGAWNSERLWQLESTNTGASLIPPVAHIGHGPAGIAYYPGTGLPDRFQNHFFYADFPGGIRHFEVEPRGTRFIVKNLNPSLEDNSLLNMDRKLLWDLSPVDVTFAPGAGIYVADWVQGWDKTGKGRIWKVSEPTLETNALVMQTRQLLNQGFGSRSATELASLLGHADMRVRLNAQWELAARGDSALSSFTAALAPSHTTLHRLHAIWGLGQIARAERSSKAIPALVALLTDTDTEVRGNAVRMLGESGSRSWIQQLPTLLRDSSTRVQFQTVWAFADLLRHPNSAALTPPPEFVALLGKEALTDPFIRHVSALALSRLKASEFQRWTSRHTQSPNPGVRLTSLLAQRRLQSKQTSQSLIDTHPMVQLEAARAIYDTPIDTALPQLAQLILPKATGNHVVPALSEWTQPMDASWPSGLPYTWEEWRSYILRRAIQAASRVGTKNHAQAILQLSLQPEMPKAVRIEAAETLGSWGTPPNRDRITGLWRPYPKRDASLAAAAVREQIASLSAALRQTQNSIPPALASAWFDMAGQLQVAEFIALATERLKTPVLVSSNGVASAVTTLNTNPVQDILRLAAWKCLVSLHTPGLESLARSLAMDSDKSLRSEVQTWLATVNAPKDWPSMERALERGSIQERQLAWNQVTHFAQPEVAPRVARWVESVREGKVEPELALDILTAARNLVKPSTPDLTASLARWTNSLAKQDSLASWSPVLQGGNAERGKRIFMERQDLACLRCHKFRNNSEGGVVGPDLGLVAAQRGTTYLLESILHPNAHIAPGFENVMLTLKDGNSLAGVVKSETAQELVVESLEDSRTAVPKSQIQTRNRAQSAMPEGLADMMTPQELRDLIAYLSAPNSP